MLRYLRLWRRFVALSFQREAEYRLSFLISVGEGLAQLALALGAFALMYRFTDEVSGWSLPEILLLVGIYRLVDGLISLQLAPNLGVIGDYIRSGEMDFHLLRPVSSQFLVSLRVLNMPEGLNALTGVGLAVIAGRQIGVHWSLPALAEAGVLMLCGLVVLYSLWFFTVTLSFWLVQVDTLGTLFYSLFETARYPVSFFRGGVRAVLTFVVPVAYATTFPSQAILGTFDHRLLPLGIVLAALALLGCAAFWRFAVRHYTSASS